MRRQEIWLLKFILFGSIIIEVIIILTTILQYCKNIKKARAKLGLTQDDLAKKADIKYTTLMKVESGVVNKPSVQTMAKIAKALDVSIEDLLN